MEKQKLDIYLIEAETNKRKILSGSVWTVGDLINLELNGLQAAVKKTDLLRILGMDDDGK